MASNTSDVFDRLVGLETEYAIRFQSREESAPTPSKFQIYRALVSQLRRRVLLSTAKHFKEGVFLASGGAVWFESERPCSNGGLIEGALPECRGPRQVVAYQRAQDRLIASSAQDAIVEGEVSLLKNDRDAKNNVYGAQENYEATIATGWQLWLWRCGLVVILPLVVLTWLSLLGMCVVTLTYYALAGLVCSMFPRGSQRRRQLTAALLGRDWVELGTSGHPSPPWVESALLVGTRVVTSPLALGLYLLLRITAFRKTRQQLLPFLASRAIISGAGMVDEKGDFQLADKAPAMNVAIGFGGLFFDRPIFNFGHFFKALCVEVPFSWQDFCDLFAARQRLQIGLGDSNMAEVAEFLRVGTTLLVLDVIEAGEMPPVPVLHRPIHALKQICRDPSLTVKVSHRRGQVSGLELQRFYLEACRAFLSTRPLAPAEAFEVIQRWEQVLDRLEGNPDSLVGSLDWVTKRYLLAEAEVGATWESRKKIDLRYHELSNDGYFARLQAAGIVTTIITAEELDRAMRNAPPNTPATTRAHYLREFSQGVEPLTVNWKRVVIGRGRGAKVIRLADHGRRDSIVPPPHARPERSRRPL